MNTDILGQAITDFFYQHAPEDITVHAPDFDEDTIPVSYLFREHSEMPQIEQKALQLAYGNILDVGCGAGSHSLHLQQQGFTVTAIDISAGAINICKERGVKNATAQNLFEIKEQQFDTLLFLMNGSGIVGTLANIDVFFNHLKTIIHPNGQILLDSSDIGYLFTDEDGGFWVDPSAGYYGEMQYQLHYKGTTSDWFDWLYLDYNTLQNAANANGFICELILEGAHHEYLAKLTLAAHTL